jgi:putative endonuclease
VGSTADLKRRLAEHRRGKTKTTTPMTDLMLVYYEACLSEKDAEARERQLKTGFGRAYLKRRLHHGAGG